LSGGLGRSNVGSIVARNLFEIVDGGDDLGRDPEFFRGHPQQHFQQFDRCAIRIDRFWSIQRRQRFGIASEPALHRIDDVLAPARALEPLGQRAHM